MRTHTPHAKRAGISAAIFAVIVTALLLNVPAAARATPTVSPSTATPAAGSTPYVTWNGNDIANAGTASSALSIDLSQSATLNYSWSAAAGIRIHDVRLEMFYFGFAVTTRDVFLNPSQTSGPVSLGWTPVSVGYVLEGVYRLTASLIAPNGSTMWSENFYVRGTAPLGFVALLPIVLLLLVVYELYGLFRSGRYAALGRTSATPPPTSPSTETPPEGTTTPAEPPSQETPPPAGGSP